MRTYEDLDKAQPHTRTPAPSSSFRRLVSPTPSPTFSPLAASEPVFEMLEEAAEEENFPWECYEDDDDDDSTSYEGSFFVKEKKVKKEKTYLKVKKDKKDKTKRNGKGVGSMGSMGSVDDLLQQICSRLSSATDISKAAAGSGMGTATGGIESFGMQGSDSSRTELVVAFLEVINFYTRY